MILIKNKIKKIKINESQIKKDVAKMLRLLNYQDFDIGILFTTNNTIQKFNKKYRKKNKATDILSFPYHTELKAGEKISLRQGFGSQVKIQDSDDKNLGDIIISLEFAKQDALRLNHSLKEHLNILIAHGIAHLMGHDHKTDSEYKKMSAFEKKLLKVI